MLIILKYNVGLDTDNCCKTALSGQQALEIIKKDFEANGKSKFNLILMDCNMPLMDGYEATRRVREYLYLKNQPQPIISAVTGHVEQEYIDFAVMAGMNQVLSKPVNYLLLKDLLKGMGFKLNQN